MATIWAPQQPDYDAFFQAVQNGDLAEVKAALTPDIDVNNVQPPAEGSDTGRAALHMAS